MRKSQALRGRRPPGPPIAGSAPVCQCLSDMNWFTSPHRQRDTLSVYCTVFVYWTSSQDTVVYNAYHANNSLHVHGSTWYYYNLPIVQLFESKWIHDDIVVLKFSFMIRKKMTQNMMSVSHRPLEQRVVRDMFSWENSALIPRWWPVAVAWHWRRSEKWPQPDRQFLLSCSYARAVFARAVCRSVQRVNVTKWGKLLPTFLHHMKDWCI